MLPYNYGIHYDASVGGLVTADNQKAGFDGGPDLWSLEVHFQNSSYARSDFQYLTQQFPSNSSGSVSLNFTSGSIQTNGLSTDVSIPTDIPDGTYVRVRFVKNRTTGELTCEADFGSGAQAIDVAGETAMAGWVHYIAGLETGLNFSLIRVERDFGNGWEAYINIDASLVPAKSGGYVTRGDTDATDGSENRLYDTVDGSFLSIANAGQPNTFLNIYDIASINGETDSPVINLGSIGNTVTMSNEIGPDSVTLSDGDNTYDFIINTTGATTTFGLPLTSDDTLPKFGTDLTLSVIKGPDAFTKTVSFQPPTGNTLVTLENPVELDESSLTFGTGLNPVAGDFYSYTPTSDFNVNVNNVLEPQGPAPWQHTIWYLSGAGLRELTLESGYGAANINPTASAGPDQIDVPAGATVTLDGSASSDEDGTVASYLWEQLQGDTVTLSDATAAQPTFTAPSTASAQSLQFRLTVTDALGATNFDTVSVGVLAIPAVIPTASITTQAQTITTSDSVTLSADTINADSYLWTCTSGQSPTFVSTTTEDTSATLNEDGAHTFRLTVASSTGDTAFDEVVVTAEANARPTFVGDTSSITVEYDSTFTAPAFTVVDAEDGPLGDATVTGTVDTSTLGDYTLTVTGPADSNGLSPTTVDITVSVVDTTAPIITPDTSGDITIAVGDAWPNPTATVTDNYDADRSIFSDTTTLDTSAPASGTITFTATDSSGNVAAAVTQNYVVLADYTDVIETVAQVPEWEVIGDGKIRAFKGRSNREVFKFRPSESEGLILTQDGYFDFSAPYFDKLEVKMNGEIIDTTSSSVLIGDDTAEICARLGDLGNLNNNNTSGRLTFIVYVGGDTRGTVVGSPALGSKNIDVTVSEV